MDNLTNKIIEKIKGDIWQYATISPKKINFTEDVVNACKANYCGNYNKIWKCPPNVGKLDDLRRHYQDYNTAFIYTTKHNIEDPYDIEGMFAARLVHDKVDDKIIEFIKENRGEILGAGACNVCSKCAFPNSCRFPEKAKTSVEATGIDVVDLSRNLKINYINGENTVTYFSIIFYNQD